MLRVVRSHLIANIWLAAQMIELLKFGLLNYQTLQVSLHSNYSFI